MFSENSFCVLGRQNTILAVVNNPRPVGRSRGESHMPMTVPYIETLVVAGASARAIAESAARAGWRVHAADLFADLDLRAVAAVAEIARPYPAALPAIVAGFPPGPWLYCGAVENHPQLIAAISESRPLAGCSPAAVAEVRDPTRLSVAIRAAGLGFPETRRDAVGIPRDGSWLVKPLRSAGGHGIAAWQGDAGMTAGAADHVWQQRVRGRPWSVSYLFAARGCRLLGCSRQLLGRRWCHAPPFGFCGSVDIAPDSLPAAGLVRQTSSALAAGDAERMALVYRLDAPEGSFAAQRRFLPRRVEASVATRVTVEEREIAVSETIRLDVLHVPLEDLELRLAAAVVESGSLEIRQAGQLLDPSQVEETGEVDDSGLPLVLVRVLLLEPLLGRGEVTVLYRLPTPPVPLETTVAVDVPLPLPVVSGAIRQVATIEEAATLAVMPRSDSWRRDVAITTGGGRTWSVAKPSSLLPLALSARAPQAAGVTVVEAAWLRTRLFPDRREDVAIYVVTPSASQIEITLPAMPAASSVEVRLDGSAAPLPARDDGRLLIDIAAPGGGSRLLEVRTTSPWGGTFAGLGLPCPLPLAAPRFATDVLERQFSWEVALLPDDHLLGLPPRWTSQQRWRWAGLGWRCEPTVATRELADWITATLGRPAVEVSVEAPQQQRRLVYAGIGPPGVATPWVVPTWVIVLVSSGAVLAIGLGMVYRANWRRPAVGTGVAAAVALAACVAPETAMLAGQAAVPGAVLAALAAVLRWLTDQRPHRRNPSPPTTGQASSLTRSAVATASLIVAPSLSPTPVGRDVP